MAQSESIGTLASALCKAQAAMGKATKDKVGQVGQQKTKYADLTSVWDACRSALTENGLAVAQYAEPDDPAVLQLTTVLMHTSGEWISGTERIPLAKHDPQGYGSAITYGRRFGLAAMVGVCTADDDGAAATQGVNDARDYQQRRQQAHSAPQQRPAPAQAKPNGGAQEHPKGGSWAAAREAFKIAYAAAGHPADRASVMAVCQELLGDKEPKRELGEYTEQQLVTLTMRLSDTADPFAEEQAATPKLPIETPAAFR